MPKIRKRGNSWYAEVYIGRDKNGKKIRDYVTGRTKKEVEDEIARIRRELATGAYVPPSKHTVESFARYWLEKYAAQHTKPTTYAAYKGIIEHHVIPLLGHIPLTRLRPTDLVDYYAALSKRRKDNREQDGLARNTILKHHRVIHAMLESAVQWGEVARNVADAVDAPTEEWQEADYWTPEEARRFLETVANHRLFALFAVAILTGLRRGEILALKWDAIDFETNAIAVRRNWVVVRQEDGKHRPVLADVKTRTSRRNIAMSPVLRNILLRHKEQQDYEKAIMGPMYEDQGFVFCQPNGRPYYPDNVCRRLFHNLCEKAGARKIRFHDLRHTHATLMLARGQNIKLVSERMGHSSVRVTVDKYGHVIPAAHREAADALDDLAPALPDSCRTNSPETRGKVVNLNARLRRKNA